MKRNTLLTIIVGAAIAIPGLSHAQETSATISDDSGVSYSEPLIVPTPMNSLQLPLSFLSESPRSNILSGGVQLGSGFNDNALLTPGKHLSNVSYLVAPKLEMRQSRERWGLDLAYSPALTVNQQLSDQNQTAHDLGLIVNYGLSPHVNLLLRNNFRKTNNLFSGVFDSTAGAGPLQQSNMSVILPLADTTTNNSGIDLTYRTGPNSVVGFGGNFYFVNYGRPSSTTASSALIDSRSASATSSYAHRFSNRHWLGMGYSFQQFMFDRGQDTSIQRILAFYSLSIARESSFSLWAGPQYSNTSGESALAGAGDPLMYGALRKWTPSGGAQLQWQSGRSGLRAGYLWQISDGAGLAEAVTLQQADLEFRRQWTKRWTTNTGLAFATNRPLQELSSSASFRSWQANAGLEYRLTDSLGMNLSYGREQQRYLYRGAPSSLGNQNRIWLTFSYFFNRPLGR